MATGYEDIERLTSQKQAMLDESLQKQNDIINKQTQMQVDSLARQKEQIDKEATAQNRALYQDYKQANNPFGAQAESLAGQGLANSGYAETTMARLYNTYQNNITNTLNNARSLKADVDFQINQARQTGDITLAENALKLYNQKLQLLSEEYDLRNNREQYLYQKQQDALAQANWQKEFDYQKSQADRNYNYQVARDKVADTQWQQNFNYQKSQADRNYNYQLSRDKVADSQWQKEYELSKKAKASSSSAKSSSSKSSSSKSSKSTKTSSKTSSSSASLVLDDAKTTQTSKSTSNTKKEYTPQEIISKIKNVQGPNVTNSIEDGISGKRFKSVDELLNYYGYVGVND